MNSYRLFATALAAVMVLSALAPLGAAATAADGDEELETNGDELTVTVDERVVTVTSNGSIVEDAAVEATATDENASYAFEGTTGADGTVALDEPEEDVTVTVVATADGETAQTETSLEAPADGLSIGVEPAGGAYAATLTADGEGVANASISVSTVDGNASYADAGTHATDENGTIALAAPTGNESVEIELEATVDGETVSTTAVLEPGDGPEDEPKSFGALVSAFVENAKHESSGPLGLTIANFVVEHNPGNAPDHAGPPAHAGPSGDEKDTRGPPDHAGGSSSNGGGNGNDKAGNGGNGNGNGGNGNGNNNGNGGNGN